MAIASLAVAGMTFKWH